MNREDWMYIDNCSDLTVGEGVTIVPPVNLYGCIIGDDSFVGPFTEIQKYVKIGKRTKIQSHSFLCSLVEIGSDCFIGHGVMFINDTFSETGCPDYEGKNWKPTYIGNHVNLGSNSTILPVNICDYVTIGAGSVVTKDIVKPGIYVGNPARFLRDNKK